MGRESQNMSESSTTRVRWDEMPRERLSERLERRYITGQQITLAQFFLAKGCLVAPHSHDSEQMSHVVQGCLRFRLNQGPPIDVRAGEVLLIPANALHEAEAIEDCIVLDSFSPIRRDWLEQRDDYLRR
jgi:quercetin dioxygenase-like cupin family protein